MKESNLITRVLKKTEDSKGTTFLLVTPDEHPAWRISYSVPFLMPSFLHGEIHFLNPKIPLGAYKNAPKFKMEHRNYKDATFYSRGEDFPILEIKGSDLALIEEGRKSSYRGCEERGEREDIGGLADR